MSCLRYRGARAYRSFQTLCIICAHQKLDHGKLWFTPSTHNNNGLKRNYASIHTAEKDVLNIYFRVFYWLQSRNIGSNFNIPRRILTEWLPIWREVKINSHLFSWWFWRAQAAKGFPRFLPASSHRLKTNSRFPHEEKNCFWRGFIEMCFTCRRKVFFGNAWAIEKPRTWLCTSS